MPLMKRIDY
jgi:hypothetical protein